MSLVAEERTRLVDHHPTLHRAIATPVTPAEPGGVADVISARIAEAKRRLLDGGLLQEVEWGIGGERDVRGRRTFTYTMLDALIEQRPGLDRGQGLVTDRSDNTVLTVLDPVSITDEDLFRWGGHTYSIKSIDGVIKNETTGVRFSSEVVVIR